MLEECRDLMTNRMRSSMSRMMGYVEEVLHEMATVDSNTADASHYIEAVREIRMKKREIQVRFENRFMNLYQDSVRQMKSGESVRGSTEVDSDLQYGLILPKNNESITIKDTLKKARQECRSALSILDSHVSKLFEQEKIDKFVNPMQPSTVLGAFWESCRDIRAGDDIRYILVDMFERYVVEDLHNVYDDLNNLFGYYYNADTNNVVERGTENQNNLNVINHNDVSKLLSQNSLLVKKWVDNRIEQRISKLETPDFIRQFLLESWSLVLEDIYEKFSEKSNEWDRAMQVADELINCAQLSEDREVRTQQIWMLPGLIYRVKVGMKAVSLPLKIQADFLSALKAHHIQVTELNLEKEVS